MRFTAGKYLQLRTLLFAALALGSLGAGAQAAPQGVKGDWREPGGSVIEIASCGSDLCARLVVLSKTAPVTTDTRNPDPQLRSRSLCGLTIGTGFHPDGAAAATDGKLYDPKSGKTYSGEMHSDGDTLHLRGYVGLKMFGRTEDWTRTPAPAAACQ